jgi:hypothetical protein
VAAFFYLADLGQILTVRLAVVIGKGGPSLLEEGYSHRLAVLAAAAVEYAT